MTGVNYRNYFWNEGEGLNELLHDILLAGVKQTNQRTGEDTLSLFGGTMYVEPNTFPFTTNMLNSPRLAFEEMMFFLRGETDTSKLEEVGVHFWTGNTTREFLDERGLKHLPEKSLGRAYSAQWRDFGGMQGVSIDQLKELVKGLQGDPEGRRHIVTLWNPQEQSEMALPPCWLLSGYVVIDGALHLHLYNRSLDVLMGCRFALMNYKFLQIMLCNMFNLEEGVIKASFGHTHIYSNQIEFVGELLERDFVSGSSIKLNKDIKSLDELLSTQWCDWEMDYKYNKEKFKTKRPNMVA